MDNVRRRISWFYFRHIDYRTYHRNYLIRFDSSSITRSTSKLYLRELRFFEVFLQIIWRRSTSFRSWQLIQECCTFSFINLQAKWHMNCVFCNGKSYKNKDVLWYVIMMRMNCIDKVLKPAPLVCQFGLHEFHWNYLVSRLTSIQWDIIPEMMNNL
jgi:hypothetical protein